MSCFKWLELFPLKKNKTPQNINNFDYEDTRNSINNENESDSESIFLNFTDKEVILHDGQEIENKQDKQLRDSMLILTYLNMSICFMKQGHFKEALECLEDGRKLNDRNSLLYFRRSQAVASNLCSDIKRLMEAKQDIEKAIYLNQFEEKNEQKIYIEQAHFIENRVKYQREKIKNIVAGKTYIILNFLCNGFCRFM